MLVVVCENCKTRTATLHLTGWTKIGRSESEPPERIEHHFCSECASELKQSSELLNPLVRAGPGARTINLRIVSVSPVWVVAREVSSVPGAVARELSFLRARLPPRYAKLGMKFDVTCNDRELEWLRGKG